MENQIIDIAIGLALTFMVVSILVSSIQEFMAGLLKSRSVQLENGIKCLLFGNIKPGKPDEQKFIEELFKHPLLYNFSKHDRLSSYLPSSNFARAVIEVVNSRLQQSGRYMEGVSGFASAVESSSWNQLLSPLIADAGGDINQFRQNLETQYDHMMDRVSGWYKRRAQGFMLLYGLLIAVMLNVDALEITSRLWFDPVMRAAVVASATELEKNANGDFAAVEKQLSAYKDMKSLPIGWPTRWMEDQTNLDDNKPEYFLFSLVGWMITALAASMGAPFWFDAIGKLVKLKGAGNTPERAAAAKAGIQSTTIVQAPDQQALNERNAIIDLYALRHKDDESYRPIKTEELW